MEKNYIIIDTFLSEPLVLTDENGNTLYFDSYDSATRYAKSNLQRDYFKVVEL